MKTRLYLLAFCALSFVGLSLNFAGKSTSAPHAKIKTVICHAFDTSHVIVSPSDCNVNNGSVIGLQGTGTGTLVFTWYNAQNVVVGNLSDLTNVPAGVYKVVLADSSKCMAISLTYTIGIRNPVIIDNTNTVITSPGCNQTNGSITNVNTGNATSFQWIDANYTPVSTNKNLTGVGAGVYILTATNATGCSAQARYTITPGAYAPTLAAYNVTASDCGATGTFEATFNMSPSDPLYPYVIYNSAGNTVASGAIAYNPLDSTRIYLPLAPPPVQPGQPLPDTTGGIPAGTYKVATQGPGDCLTTVLTFTIPLAKFAIDTSHVVVTPNVCGRYTGVINGIQLIGPTPTIDYLKNPRWNKIVGYFWLDSKGNRVGDELFLEGVPSGTYTMYAVNDDLCVTQKVSFTIRYSVSTASTPVVNNVKLCLPGIAALDVQNKDPKTHYYLYDSTKTLIDTSIAGYFVQKVNNTTVFYIGSVNGICVSPLGKVTVTVEDPGISFPNAFTPNNDGINDYWQINGLENYPGTEVSVFNRYGQRIYHSINYSSPFDGRSNGGELPAGVYYYIIDTKKPGCQAGITGNLTIIRFPV